MQSPSLTTTRRVQKKPVAIERSARANGCESRRRTRLFAPSAPSTQRARTGAARVASTHPVVSFERSTTRTGRWVAPAACAVRQERGVELCAGGDHELGDGGTRVESDVCALLAVLEGGAPNGYRINRLCCTFCICRISAKGVAQHVERAPGDSAAARLLARMTAVEQGDPRASPRQLPRRVAAGRPGTDNRHIERLHPTTLR